MTDRSLPYDRHGLPRRSQSTEPVAMPNGPGGLAAVLSSFDKLQLLAKQFHQPGLNVERCTQAVRLLTELTLTLRACRTIPGLQHVYFQIQDLLACLDYQSGECRTIILMLASLQGNHPGREQIRQSAATSLSRIAVTWGTIMTTLNQLSEQSQEQEGNPHHAR